MRLMARASREICAKRVERRKDGGLSAKELAAELDVSPISVLQKAAQEVRDMKT
jgi:hypothetical protein